MSVEDEYRFGIRPYCIGGKAAWALEKYVRVAVMSSFVWGSGGTRTDTILVDFFDTVEEAERMIEHLTQPRLLRR